MNKYLLPLPPARTQTTDHSKDSSKVEPGKPKSLLGLIIEVQGRSCFRSVSGFKAVNHITEKSLSRAEDVSHCRIDGTSSSHNLPHFIKSSTSGDAENMRPCASGERWHIAGREACVPDISGEDLMFFPFPSFCEGKATSQLFRAGKAGLSSPPPQPLPTPVLLVKICSYTKSHCLSWGQKCTTGNTKRI